MAGLEAAHVKPDRRAKMVSRKHHGNLGPAAGNMGMVFWHVICVAEAAAMYILNPPANSR